MYWLLNEPMRRSVLAKALEKDGDRPLHILIWRAFYDSDTALKATWPAEDFCYQDAEDRWFMNVPRFASWLEKRSYTGEQARSVAIVACAFAMLQPQDAQRILTALVEHDSVYAKWLLPPESATPPLPEPVKEKPVQPPDATLSAALPLSAIPPGSLAPNNDRDTFDLANLRHGQNLLNAFLSAHQHLRRFSTRLTSEVDNFCLSDEPAEANLLTEFRDALNRATSTAVAARRWLARLASDLQSPAMEKCKTAEPALETLHTHTLRPRETLDMLRGVCEQVNEVLESITANAVLRAERLLSMVAEINEVEDLLGRKHYAPSLPLPNANLVRDLQLLLEVEARFEKVKSERVAFVLETKRVLERDLDFLVARSEINQFAPDVVAQVQGLRTTIQTCSTPPEAFSAQQAIVQLENTLNSRPETRNLSELARAALANPSALAVIPVAQTLNARNRGAEALSLLSCLQFAAEIESAGPDDFSPFVDELLLAAASLAEGDSPPLLWIDGVFQQPWLRSLVRHDLANHTSWERLGLAFVVQEHTRGTEMELDLFFRLDYQTAWHRDRFPLLGQLLSSIATRHRTKILANPPPSPLCEVETRIARLFERNQRGDYLQQAAAGDTFHDMERFQLFPAMERLLDTVRRHCQNARWSEAFNVADNKPEKLLNDACRAAGIQPSTSPFYRRQVMDAHNGYLPRFLQDLRSFIEADRTEHDANRNFVVARDLLLEVDSLAAQDKKHAPYWVAVRQSLAHPSSSTVSTVKSGEEIFARLAHHYGPVATLAPDYVIAACQQGGSPKPTLRTLSQMLNHLVAPPSDLSICRLQQSECCRHALNVLRQLPLQHQTDFQPSVLESLQTQLERQLEQLQAEAQKCWKVLRAAPASSIRPEDYESAFADGRFAYLKSILAEAEARAASVSANARNETATWLRAQLERLTTIKKAAVTAERSDDWLAYALEYCANTEKILLLGERDIASDRPLAFSRDRLESLVAALQFVVENSAQSFTEVQGRIAELTAKSGGETSTFTLPPSIPIPEVAKPWEMLRSGAKVHPEQVNRSWEEFARNFCAVCRLHYELHQTLKFSAVKDFRWGRYTTRFLDPRSSWLDRDVILYLCFADKTPPSELEPLALQLDSSRDCLNIVFVPQGFVRLSRLWKYSPSQSHYLLVSDDLLTGIFGARDRDGKARHDVPLRQALHQSAENLTSIGLFKSEGYVHHRKNIFVGRELALQQLAQQPASAIWGGRRTGKTSLLQALGERLRHPSLKGGPYNVALVYGDRATGDPDLGIARAIAKDLRLQEPGSLEHFGSLMQEVCSRERIAVLIDEMDRYIQLSRGVHGHAAFPLARLLRGLSQRDSSQRFKLVYAGFKQLYHDVRIRPGADPSDPFKNILEPVMKDFRDLDLKEVEELLQIGFGDMLGVEMELAVPRLVTEKTSGHPAFVQRFCERLLARLSKRRHHETRLRLTSEDVEATYLEETPLGSSETAFIDYVNETLDWNVSHLERAVLLAISIEIRSRGASDRQEFSGPQIAALLKEWCAADIDPPDPQDLQNALHMLSMTKMLTPSGPSADLRFRITYPAYIDFMSRLEKLQRVELFKSLKDYHKEEKGQTR